MARWKSCYWVFQSAPGRQHYYLRSKLSAGLPYQKFLQKNFHPPRHRSMVFHVRRWVERGGVAPQGRWWAWGRQSQRFLHRSLWGQYDAYMLNQP